MDKVRAVAKMLAVATFSFAPESRERSFAVKHLEDWCQEMLSAIARNQNAKVDENEPYIIDVMNRLDREVRVAGLG